MEKEIKLSASKVMEMCMFESDGHTLNKNYENARLLVIEDFKVIVSENLKNVSFKTYKLLQEYNVIKWSTDWEVSDNEEIKTLIIFVEKVNA